jgi:c-di-GMP-binding flagellar brake protein YcgR
MLLPPSIGQIVQLDVEGFKTLLSSRVEDGVAPDLRLSLPSADGTLLNLAVGRELTIIWPREEGLARVSAIVRTHIHDDQIPLVHVELTDRPARLQRRDLVRARISGRVTVLDDEGQALAGVPEGFIVNLSGAGMLAKFESATDFPETLPIRIDVEGHLPYFPGARLVRTTEDHGCAFEFVDFDGPEKDRLVRMVFGQHRQEHARQRLSHAA